MRECLKYLERQSRDEVGRDEEVLAYLWRQGRGEEGLSEAGH